MQLLLKKYLSILAILSISISLAYAEDTNTTEGEGQDICYSVPYTEGTFCTGFGGVNCTNYIPIINSSGEELSNIDVLVSTENNGTMNGSLNEECGVTNEEGNCTNYSENQIAGKITVAGYSYGYNLDDMSVDDNERLTYTESSVSINFNNDAVYATYTKNGTDYYSVVYPCGAIGNSDYATGPFDAWDTDSNITERAIKTKVVSSTFSLRINSLNDDNNATEVKDGIDIEYRLYDLNSSTPVSDWETYDASEESAIKEFTVNSAYKDVRVQFGLCYITSTSGGISTTTRGVTSISEEITSTELHPLSDCTDEGIALDTSTFSTDNFAIRPYAFRVFGGDSYSRAGEEFTVDIKAVDYNNYTKNTGTSDDVIGTAKYDVVFSNISLSSNFYTPTDSELAIMYKNVMEDSTATAAASVEKARVATCSEPGIFTKVNDTDNFIDGNLTANLKFSETGILTVAVNEILGHEFAIVDTDDTPTSQRLILGSSIINSKSDINSTSLLLVNPYSIDTVAEYNTSNSKQWLYMDDISSAATSFTKPKMSAYIHYTVTARNKDGAITKNFTATCFPDVTESWPTPSATDCPRVNGLKLNTTYDFKLAATINTTAPVNLSIFNGDVNQNALYIDSADQDANLSIGDNAVRKATMYPKQFTNGEAESYVHFNIDRNVSIPRNPVIIKVVDANSWLSWVGSASPAAFNGTTLNKSYNYIYGRTNAPRERFSANSGQALIYYESYCTSTDSFNNTCNKNLLPNGSDSNTTNDPRWFKNTFHSSSTDGTVGALSNIVQKNSASQVTATALTSGNPEKVTLNYSGTSYPYKTTMLNKADKWLIYNKYNENADSNEFQVEFINSDANWAGIHETNATTDTNASKKTNRRTMW